MAHVIAVAGKGGVGKTTLCGMLIQYLCEQGKDHSRRRKRRNRTGRTCQRKSDS